MSTVSELMTYVGIGLVVILAWVFMTIVACKAYEWWQNDPRWSRAVADIYEGRSFKDLYPDLFDEEYLAYAAEELAIARVGFAVAQAIVDSDVTLQDLQEKLGDRVSVADLLMGEENLTIRQLALLERILGVKMEISFRKVQNG